MDASLTISDLASCVTRDGLNKILGDFGPSVELFQFAHSGDGLQVSAEIVGAGSAFVLMLLKFPLPWLRKLVAHKLADESHEFPAGQFTAARRMPAGFSLLRLLSHNT